MAVGVLQNAHIFKNVILKKQFVLTGIVNRNSTVPQSILLERNADIIISIPNTSTYVADMIGPPHPVSNLRPVIWYRSANETFLQRKLKDLQESTQSWNQQFWETHNTKFVNEKNEYFAKHLPIGKQTLTADEMSEFYKEFLDKNWNNHVIYNLQWYKKNFTILFLSICVHIERIFQRS